MPIVAEGQRRDRFKAWQLWLLASPGLVLLTAFLVTLIHPVSVGFGTSNLAAGLSWDDFISAGHPEQEIRWRASSPDADGVGGFWFSWRVGQPWYYLIYFHAGREAPDPSRK